MQGEQRGFLHEEGLLVGGGEAAWQHGVAVDQGEAGGTLVQCAEGFAAFPHGQSQQPSMPRRPVSPTGDLDRLRHKMPAGLPAIDHESAFEAGLALVLSGQAHGVRA